MLNFNSMLLFSEDPKKLADFYGKVLQKDVDWDEGHYYGFNAGNTYLTIGPHDKVKGKNTAPERIMFNLETKEVKEESERIKGLGARVVAEPYQPDEVSGMWISTFADPDGNYFQLMTPWEQK